MLGVPEELGGAVERALGGHRRAGRRGARPRRHGPRGRRRSRPAAVAPRSALWGDADQQATYLPAFAGDDVPAAALAMLEPRPLFDPFALETTARARRRRLRAQRRQVARAARRRAPSCSSSPPSSRATGPALFLVESGTQGVGVEAEPGDGRARRRHRRRCCSTTCACPAERAARRRRPGRLRRGASTAPGSPGARWRSAPRRRCSTT